MKKTLFPLILLILISFSCGKDDPPPSGTATVYMNLSANSVRNYEVTNNTPPPTTNPYSVTSTTRDTLIGTRSYHIFTNSAAGLEYYNQTGTDYYTYQALPAPLNTSVENLYLKSAAAVNESWSQSYNVMVQGIPVTVNVVHKIIEKGVSRTVNNITYSNVIHVSTTISSPLIPSASLTTDIHSYYAPNVGLIENTNVINLNYMGLVSNTDTRTILKSATIL